LPGSHHQSKRRLQLSAKEHTLPFVIIWQLCCTNT